LPDADNILVCTSKGYWQKASKKTQKISRYGLKRTGQHF